MDRYKQAIRKNVLGRTQAEVKEKLKRAIGECAEVDIERAEEYTVGAWVRTWYETYSKPHVRESTQRFYEDYIEHHVVPRIGGIKLTKLTGRDIQKMYKPFQTVFITRGFSVLPKRFHSTFLHLCGIVCCQV